jgi:hypothetical protein
MNNNNNNNSSLTTGIRNLSCNARNALLKGVIVGAITAAVYLTHIYSSLEKSTQYSFQTVSIYIY